MQILSGLPGPAAGGAGHSASPSLPRPTKVTTRDIMVIMMVIMMGMMVMMIVIDDINNHRHPGNKVNIFRSSSFLPFASPGLFSVDPLTSVRRSFQAARRMMMMILLFLLVMMMMIKFLVKDVSYGPFPWPNNLNQHKFLLHIHHNIPFYSWRMIANQSVKIIRFCFCRTSRPGLGGP